MAKNIELNYFNGSSYDILYTETFCFVSQIKGTGEDIFTVNFIKDPFFILFNTFIIWKVSNSFNYFGTGKQVILDSDKKPKDYLLYSISLFYNSSGKYIEFNKNNVLVFICNNSITNEQALDQIFLKNGESTNMLYI